MGDLGSIPGLGGSPGGGHGHPLQSSCLENPQGQRSLAGYNPWGHKESDTTEGLTRAHICSPCACSFCINRYNEATEGLVSNTSIKDFYESSMFNMKQNLKDFFAGMNDILFQFNNG